MKSIIHNYNNDLTELISYLDDVVVYDCSDSISLEERIYLESISKGNFIETENIGHSLANWLDWIISNYNEPPPQFALLKGNILNRHIDKETFSNLIKNRRYTPLFHDSELIELEGISYLASPGLLAEVNNSWYVDDSKCKFFKSLNEFLHFFFQINFDPKFVTFAPGGNYIVQDYQISKYPIEFWQMLRKIISYDYFVSEAWMLERLLHFIFTTETPIQDYLTNETLCCEKLYSLESQQENRRNKTQKNNSKKWHIRLMRVLMRNNVRLLKKFKYTDYWPV
jgi:hypothetical protein